jgi:dGTPase
LAAIAKYPWPRSRGDAADEKKKRKFSFFDDDAAAAGFALAGLPPETKTLECQVMDLADAITYSVHDLEDFYRAGLVPVERLVRSEE